MAHIKTDPRQVYVGLYDHHGGIVSKREIVVELECIVQKSQIAASGIRQDRISEI